MNNRCYSSFSSVNQKNYIISYGIILAFPLPPCIISIRINPVGWVMKKLYEELLKEIHTKVMHEIVEDMVKEEFAKPIVIRFSSCVLSRFSL